MNARATFMAGGAAAAAVRTAGPEIGVSPGRTWRAWWPVLVGATCLHRGVDVATAAERCTRRLVRLLATDGGEGDAAAIFRATLGSGSPQLWPRRRAQRGRAAADPVRDALRRLPGGCRLVVVLRSYAGLSPADTAGVLGCTPATAVALHDRALEALARRLGVRAPEVPRLLLACVETAPPPPRRLARQAALRRTRRRRLWAGAALALVGLAGPGAEALRGWAQRARPVAVLLETAPARLAPAAWQPLPDAPLRGRAAPVVVWTGTELIVWGGLRADPQGGEPLADGAAFLPGAGSWRPLPPAPLPGGAGLSGVWTGEELLLWGGQPPAGAASPALGASYSPREDRWEAIPAGPLTARSGQAAVWTGRELVVWGGRAERGLSSGGAAYDPVTRRWRRLSHSPLGPRTGHVAVWSGQQMLVWGGWNGQVHAADGAAWDPRTNRWRRLAEAPLLGRSDPASAWTGRELIVWSGRDAGRRRLLGGGAYDPERDRWRLLPISPPPGDRVGGGPPAAVWTGRELIVDPGRAGRLLAYEPTADTWRSLPVPADVLRLDPALAWTGEALLVWGGVDAGGDGQLRADGARHVPQPGTALQRPRRSPLQ